MSVNFKQECILSNSLRPFIPHLTSDTREIWWRQKRSMVSLTVFCPFVLYRFFPNVAFANPVHPQSRLRDILSYGKVSPIGIFYTIAMDVLVPFFESFKS